MNDISIDKLLRLRAQKLTLAAIGKQVGLSEQAVRGRLRRHDQKTPVNYSPQITTINDTQSEVERLRAENEALKALLMEREEDDLFAHEIGTPLTVEGDLLIAGDIHCNTVNKGFMRRPLEIAKQYLKKPRRFIIAGDLLNADAFSGYEPTYPTPSFGKEIKAARAFFDLYLSVFDEIYVFPGNHDLRPVKRSHAAIDFHMVMKIISHEKRIKVSHIGHMLVNTHMGTYRVTHGSEYSVNQLVVAEQLAHKNRQHIISWHEHHTAVGLDRFKNWILVNGGGLFDSDGMAYTKIEDNKKPNMANGFVMLRNGYPYLFTDKFTDWDFWIDKKKAKLKKAG